MNEKSGKEKEKDKDKAVQPSRELRKVDKVEMALTRIVAVSIEMKQNRAPSPLRSHLATFLISPLISSALLFNSQAVMRHTREDLANRESASQARGQKLMKVISDTLKELSIER